MALPMAAGGLMTEPSGDMKSLIEEIAKALVDDPSQVSVQVVEGDEGEGILLELRVAPNDVGKVIGKQGRTARSMRTLLSAAGMKLHKRYSLDIVEDEQPKREEKLSAASQEFITIARIAKTQG